MIINIGQILKFTVSNSSSMAHYSKRSEDPPWHNGYNRTDIAEFGPIPKQFWLTMAQSYRKVAIMNKDFIFIVQKSAILSPLCPLRHLPVLRALAELGFLSRIRRNTFVRLLIVFAHWTMTAAQRPLIFHISKDKYASLVTNSINCRNCSFSHFADFGSRSTSEI